MQEIKCPKCGEVFTVDESGYAAILKQVHDKEFRKEIEAQKSTLEAEKESAVSLAVAEKEKTLNKEIEKKNAEIEQLKSESRENLLKAVAERDLEIEKLKGQAQLAAGEKQLAVAQATEKLDKEVLRLKSDLELEKSQRELNEKTLCEAHAAELKRKDEQIAYYKDLKARQSTKMVGETLEQHCEIEFNKLRATAFRNAYFEKDNDARSGSKGDYIYRESSEDGVEFISVMFEMKNENDETATKHKNSDFFKELDKDRREKGCEYAVLVSMLEQDNELYAQGIVDVSYVYDKMYVIRPQFFIPMITLLRNAALNSLEYKRELAVVASQNIDVTNFENDLLTFKNDFGRNVELAGKKFKTAIDEIDKTIQHLQKTRDALVSSDHNLQIANRKAEDLTIKKLTKNNPTMKQKFEDLS